jgi:hypothetical protein
MTQKNTQPGADTPLKRALAMVDQDVESAISELSRMIAVDTSFPPGLGYDDFADLMQELVAPLGFDSERVVVPESLWHVEGGPARGRRTNLLATRKTGKPTCGLYFHVDTVPAAPWLENESPVVVTRRRPSDRPGCRGHEGLDCRRVAGTAMCGEGRRLAGIRPDAALCARTRKAGCIRACATWLNRRDSKATSSTSTAVPTRGCGLDASVCSTC